MFSQETGKAAFFDIRRRGGFVAWVATGTIGPGVENFSKWLPNAGVGIRFEVEPRMNLRVDYGLGVDSNLFYISFNEAF